MNQSPQECGDDNLAKVERYLSSGKPLPMRHGKLNVEQFAYACGLKTRQPIYKNGAIRKRLAEFMGITVASLDAIENRREIDDLRAKLLKTEQQLAAARAENDCLKTQVTELGRANEQLHASEQVMLSGRRVIS
jgi:hypothetical protein